MNKNLLDEFYFCDLYQVDSHKGYIEKEDFHSKYSLSANMDVELPFCNKVGIVLVKRSKLFKYNLREVFTGVPLDTIYENYNRMVSNDWYNYTIKGIKKEYNTFTIVPHKRTRITLDQINKYCEDHSNVEEYKNRLTELINKGEENHINKKQEEKECLENINSEVNKKLFKRV